MWRVGKEVCVVLPWVARHKAHADNHAKHDDDQDGHKRRVDAVVVDKAVLELFGVRVVRQRVVVLDVVQHVSNSPQRRLLCARKKQRMFVCNHGWRGRTLRQCWLDFFLGAFQKILPCLLGFFALPSFVFFLCSLNVSDVDNIRVVEGVKHLALVQRNRGRQRRRIVFQRRLAHRVLFLVQTNLSSSLAWLNKVEEYYALR